MPGMLDVTDFCVKPWQTTGKLVTNIDVYYNY